MRVLRNYSYALEISPWELYLLILPQIIPLNGHKITRIFVPYNSLSFWQIIYVEKKMMLYIDKLFVYYGYIYYWERKIYGIQLYNSLTHQQMSWARCQSNKNVVIYCHSRYQWLRFCWKKGEIEMSNLYFE